MTNTYSTQNNFEKIEKIFESSTSFKIRSSNDVNSAIDHIIQLLNDSFTLINKKSYPSAVFFAITAMEETAKTTYALLMKNDPKTKKNKDPLLNHAKKHSLSVSPVFNIGTRLPNAIGADNVDRIISIVNENNGLMNLRNNSIYWNIDENGARFPKDSIDKKKAQEILLFAIETFDDNLVGLTSYSLEISSTTDTMFETIVTNYTSI